MTKSKHDRDLMYEDVVGRRASAEQINLRRWIHKRYQDSPESLPGRFRYYEAISEGVITKHDAQTAVNVAGDVTLTLGDRAWKMALMWVREHKLVPDAWITDTTRSMADHTGWSSVRDGLAAYLAAIHLDPWDGGWPLIAVESQASGAVLNTMAREYRTLIAPLRGQASRSYLANEVAPKLYDGQVVLAVVDLDKVGGDISASAHERLEQFAGVTLDWRVVALTDQQVIDHSVTLIPRRDGRDGIERMVAETEALGAATIRTIVRAELDALLPTSLVDVRGREQAERVRLERMLKRFKP